MNERTFTDTGDGGPDGPRVRFAARPDGTVLVSCDATVGVAMRRVDLRRLHRWLDGQIGGAR